MIIKKNKHRNDSEGCIISCINELTIHIYDQLSSKSEMMQMAKVSTFLESLPLFVKKFMMMESMRKLTFSYGWPHEKEFVCVEDLAQAGFFYTGRSDEVVCICIYCDVILNDWRAGDIPIMEHCKFSRNCVFLYNQKICQNIPDLRGEDDLDTVLSLIPQRGIDEVDSHFHI